MSRSLVTAALVASALAAGASCQTVQTVPGFANGVCTESRRVTAQPPDNPHWSSSSPRGSWFAPRGRWFADDSHTLWASWWGKTYDGSYKVLWAGPRGADLTVTGTRLDGASAPMRADISVGDWSFAASGLYFPTAGCWQVNATSGSATMHFVVRVAS